MSTLKDLLLNPSVRPRLVDDTTRLIDSEVAAKSGLSGMAIKASYGVVQKVKPTLVREAVDNLLDRFVERMEPFYADWVSAGKASGFDSFLTSRASQVANALLGVTDDRARSISNGTIKSAYEKLRPQGQKNVEAAIPGLGKVVSRYLA